MSKFRILTIIGFLSIFSLPVFAQEDIPDEIPVDGGVSFLLAAGAAWGIKKLKDKR